MKFLLEPKLWSSQASSFSCSSIVFGFKDLPEASECTSKTLKKQKFHQFPCQHTTDINFTAKIPPTCQIPSNRSPHSVLANRFPYVLTHRNHTFPAKRDNQVNRHKIFFVFFLFFFSFLINRAARSRHINSKIIGIGQTRCFRVFLRMNKKFLFFSVS